MLIDWVTVGAQALNFLILVWLLRRFLYQPVLHAVESREKRIADELRDAAAKQAKAVEEREEFTRKNEAFEQERSSLFGKVTEAAAAERQRLLEDARKEAAGLRTRLQQGLQGEQQVLSDEIAHRICDEVFAIARKTLADLATTSLEESMTRVFIERIQGLNAHDKDVLKAALELSAGAAIVRSAFELSAQQQAAIEKTIAQVSGTTVKLQMQTVPTLVSGVELVAAGQKLAWSVSDYLGTLREGVDELLKARSSPKLSGNSDSHAEPLPAPKPKLVPALSS